MLWTYSESYKLLLKWSSIPSLWIDFLSLWTSLHKNYIWNTAEELCWYCPAQITFSVCLQGPLLKQVINLWLLWVQDSLSNLPERMRWIKRKETIVGYLLNLRKLLSLTIFEQISFLMLTIASVTLSLFIFQSCLKNFGYWQARFIFFCQFWILLHFQNKALALLFGVVVVWFF